MTARPCWRTLAAASIGIAGCVADPGPPTARIVSVAPSALAVHDDAANDLHVAIAYTDPDGDLGGGEVVVSDCRSAGAERVLPIPAIAVDPEPGVAIHGELDVVVADVGAVEPGDPPPVCVTASRSAGAFCFVLRDLAETESAPVCTEPVAIAD